MINIKKIVSTCLVATIAIATISCTKAELKNSKEESICPTSTEVTTSTSSRTSTTTSTTTRTTNMSTDMNMTTTTITTTAVTTARKETTTMTNTMIKEPTLTALTPKTTKPIVFDVEVNEEPIIEPISNYPLSGYWEGTFYSGTSMGYTSSPYGASGSTLISGYSVASNYFPFGTLLYIESDYMTGTFRVDDCGGMASNVIDFYFWDNSEVPCNFYQMGRVPITITVIE